MIATRSKLNLFRNRVSETDIQTPVEQMTPASIPEEIESECNMALIVTQV